MTDAPRIFICCEPDHVAWAERLDAWPRTNADLSAYAARSHVAVDDRLAESARNAVAAQIAEADVLVCLIGQTTFADPWVAWEIETSKSSPRCVGRVGVMLQELNQSPPGLLDCGAIFVGYKQDLVERAVRWALTEQHTKGDFTLLDE